MPVRILVRRLLQRQIGCIRIKLARFDSKQWVSTAILILQFVSSLDERGDGPGCTAELACREEGPLIYLVPRLRLAKLNLLCASGCNIGR